VAKELNLSETTVKKVQDEYCEQMNADVTFPDLTPKKHGHKTSSLSEHRMEIIDSFHESKGEFYYQEQSLKLGIPQTTLFRWMLDLGIQNETSYVKPTLTVSQTLKRIKFILHQLEDPNNVERYQHKYPNVDPNHLFAFKSFANHVWIDEAWFYLLSVKGKKKSLPGEPRHLDEDTESIRYIPKVMFLLAVGMPHILPDRTTFDGKIGIWDITKAVPAKRKSKNRPRGSIETKSTSMTAREFQDKMIGRDGVLDMIDSKLGCYFETQKGGRNRVTVIVQQDGAKPHIAKTIVPVIKAEGRKGNRLIDIETQPPQSPDLNILDLALIYSLKKAAQHAKHEANGSTTEFIRLVKETYASYSPSKLIRICALQYVAYREILKANGGNQYDMPHTGIRKRQRERMKSHDGSNNELDNCADMNVSAVVIKNAMDFYEKETGESFPWNHHPDYCQSLEAEVASSAGAHIPPVFNPGTEYFDDYDSDEADDPSDDRDVCSDDEAY